MKYGCVFFMFLFSAKSFSQENDTIYNYQCNDKWLDELIKTDSISEENKLQDYMCYMTIFDSINKKTKYTQLELLQAIGKLSDFSDGAFSEGLFYNSFDYVFSNHDSFFKTMTKASQTDMLRWVMMIYYEYGNRSASEVPYAEFIIRELEPAFKHEKYNSWETFKKLLYDFEKEHIKKLKEYYGNKN